VKGRLSSRALIVLSALATACAAETVELPPPAPVHWQSSTSTASGPTTPTEKERAVADAYTRALASPRLAALGPLLDDEVLFSLGAHNTRGRDRVVKAHEDAFGPFDGRRFVASRVWLTDSTQAVNSQAIEWTMTGTQAREWMKVAPTNKNVAIKGLTLLWTTDDGMITEVHVYLDEDIVKAQLGAGPVELRKLAPPPLPSGAATVTEHQGSAEETANVAALRGMIEALEDNREAAYVSNVTDAFTVVTLDESEPLHGKEAARTYFRNIRRAVRQVDTVIENAWGVGRYAIVEYSITGLQIAPLHRVSVAGDGGMHPLHTQFVDVAEFEGGKIARVWRYSDPASFASL
jgi:hypothetical protein